MAVYNKKKPDDQVKVGVQVPPAEVVGMSSEPPGSTVSPVSETTGLSSMEPSGGDVHIAGFIVEAWWKNDMDALNTDIFLEVQDKKNG